MFKNMFKNFILILFVALFIAACSAQNYQAFLDNVNANSYMKNYSPSLNYIQKPIIQNPTAQPLSYGGNQNRIISHLVIYCSIRGGVADFYPGWREYSPQSFSVRQGEAVNVALRRKDKKYKTTNLWVSFGNNGLGLTLCRNAYDASSMKHCQTIIGDYNEFLTGVKRNINLSRILKGAVLSCQLVDRNRPKYYGDYH